MTKIRTGSGAFLYNPVSSNMRIASWRIQLIVCSLQRYHLVELPIKAQLTIFRLPYPHAPGMIVHSVPAVTPGIFHLLGFDFPLWCICDCVCSTIIDASFHFFYGTDLQISNKSNQRENKNFCSRYFLPAFGIFAFGVFTCFAPPSLQVPPTSSTYH